MSNQNDSLIPDDIEKMLPSSIWKLLKRSINRVIIVAGNSELGFLEFERLRVSEEDLVVLINRSIHLPRFRKHPCAKLFFFREIIGTRSHHGLPPNFGNFESFEPESMNGEVGVVSTNHAMNEASMAVPLMRSLCAKGDCISVISAESSLWAGYPKGTEHQSLVPSTGYMVLSIFFAIKDMLAKAAGKSPFRIVTLGFSTNKSDRFWHGHAWSYEREYLQSIGSKIEAITIDVDPAIISKEGLAARFGAEIHRRLGEIPLEMEAILQRVDEPESGSEPIAQLGVPARLSRAHLARRRPF